MNIFYEKNQYRLRLYTSEDICFATHLHRQIELIYLLEGRLEVTTDHVTYQLTANQGVCVFPNRLHDLNTPIGEHSKLLLCILEPDFCPHFRQIFQEYLPENSFFSKKELSNHGQTALDALLELTCHFPRATDVPAYYDTLTEGYLTLLFTDLFLPDPHLEAGSTLLPLIRQKSGGDLNLEQQILLYLDNHYTEELSLEHLSKIFGISRFQLSRLFTDKLKTTFPGYLNARRLEYAQELLLTTDRSVTGIALDAGFGSTRSFFREFKNSFHTTPSAFRNHHLEHIKQVLMP